jgi:hypothetical protein
MAACHRRFKARCERPDGISASVDSDFGFNAQDFAARIGIGGDGVEVLAAICA